MTGRGDDNTGASRGRPRGGGRGRGRGKTQLWEWETYEPGPEVYAMNHRVRDEPPVITPNLSNACPIKITGTSSRILDRKQYDTPPQRQYYEVEVRIALAAYPDSTATEEGAREVPDKNLPEELHPEGIFTYTHPDRFVKAVVHVDVSRILKLVSSRELERFENAEFRKEADLDAQVKKWEAEEQAASNIEKNESETGAGRGSRMLSGLHTESSFTAANKPRRGRPSKKNRDKEEDTDIGAVSSFVANSALPSSPVQPEEDAEEEYVVDAILEHTYLDGIKYYLVKWEGYEDAADWMLEEDLEGAADLVEEYNSALREKLSHK